MMPYSVRLALQSLWHEKWINILSVLSITMGLFLISNVTMALYNIDIFTKRLPERFSVIAYLKDSLSEQDLQNIAASIRNNKNVEKLRYISKADALKELKASLKDADYILEGLGENPLPSSLEIKLKKEAVTPESVKLFISEIKDVKGIDDIQYGEKFLMSLNSLKVGMQTAGIILTTIMVSGIIFICYSTVKILFYRRKEEIETLKLLGATSGFIRTPFLIEGGTIGMVGGIISMVMIAAVYYSLIFNLAMTAPLIGSIVLPPEIVLSLPVAGIFLGITGALIAMGRIRFD